MFASNPENYESSRPATPSDLELASEFEVIAVENFVGDFMRSAVEVERIKRCGFETPDGDGALMLSMHKFNFSTGRSFFTAALGRSVTESIFSLTKDVDSRPIGSNYGRPDDPQKASSRDLREAAIIADKLLMESDLGLEARSIVRYVQDQTFNLSLGSSIDRYGKIIEPGSESVSYFSEVVSNILETRARGTENWRSLEHTLQSGDTLEIFLNDLEDIEEDRIVPSAVKLRIIFGDKETGIKYIYTRTQAGDFGLKAVCLDEESTLDLPDQNEDSEHEAIGSWPIRYNLRRLCEAVEEPYFNGLNNSEQSKAA